MNTNQYTQKTLEALQAAQQLAVEYQHNALEPAHLLHALAAQENGLIPQLLQKLNVDPGSFAAAVAEKLSALPRVSGSGRDPDKVYISQATDKVLSAAAREAKAMKDDFISVEHLFLGLLDEQDQTTSELFRAFNLKKDAFLQQLTAVRGNQRVTTDNPEDTYNALQKYGQDLVELARKQKLDPVIGRDQEIRNVIRILSRKTKNNPCLIGAPPGYVGYEEGGQLTEAVRRKPYSVVLFDEVEKAHPDVFNILLQVLDDGRITDSQGRTVDFKNTVIILTSNLGSDIILNDLEQRRAQGSNELSEDAKHQIDLLLKSKFRPEFLNRLDEIVYYKSLTKDEMRKIVDLQLQDLRNRMEEGKHLKLEVTTAAKDFIIDSAYDSVYGARPIKRFIQSRVETLIAKAIIKGSYAEGNTLTVDYDGSALVLR